MNSVLKPRLPWRPAALIAGAILAAPTGTFTAKSPETRVHRESP